MREIAHETENTSFYHDECWKIGVMVELTCERFIESRMPEARDQLQRCVPQALLRDSNLNINAQRCLAVFDTVLLASQRNRAVSWEIAQLFFGSALLNLYESIVGIESSYNIDLILCLVLSRQACETLVVSTEVKRARFGDHVTGDVPLADSDTLHVALRHLREKP
jgi:hypothetical protein